jgi:hypothetical protein
MCTVIIIAADFVLWVACLGVAKLLAGSRTSSMTTVSFVFIWFVAAAANMWIGVASGVVVSRRTADLPADFLVARGGRNLCEVEVPLTQAGV